MLSKKALFKGSSLFLAALILCSPPSAAQDAQGAESKGHQKAAAAQRSEQSTTDAKPPEDLSQWLGLLAGFEGAGGWYSNGSTSPSAYGGIKFGIPLLPAGKRFFDVTLDLGYDRVRGNDGGSAELSAMLPVFRTPGPQKNFNKNYLRVYAEPGLGYRGGGFLDGYASAKVMMVLFSDHRLTSTGTHLSPFIELQRRFPFESPLQGDNRIVIGLMTAICKDCGLD